MTKLSEPLRRVLFLLTIALCAAACSGQGVKLIHPQSGATAQCSASGFGIGASFGEGFVGGCARSYEERGYVPLERLTPEERASLERRGLLPKN